MSNIPFSEYKLPVIDLSESSLKKIWTIISITFHIISVIVAIYLINKD